MTKKEDDKAQQGKSRSYSRFEECIMLLIAKFFSKEKDINKFGEWLEKYLKEGDDLTKEETIKWNKQSEKDLYEEAYSTWDFNRYLCILKNGEIALATSICDEGADGSVSCWFEFCDEKLNEQYYVEDIEYWVLLEKK